MRRETSVSAPAPAAVDEKVADLLNRKEVMIAAIAGGAAALLGLVLLLTVPRYRQEHLLHENPDKRGWDEGVMLADLRRGFSSRNAFGTPEVKNALQFRLSGRRGLGQVQVLTRPLKPFFQFYVNDEMKTGWTPLSHGDRLRVRGARFQHYYRFFSAPLTPDEFESLVPEAPEPAAAIEGLPGQELIIEIPTDFADTMGSAGAAEPAGTADAAAFEETLSGEQQPASPFEDLDTILGIDKPVAPPRPPAEELEPSEPGASPETVTEARGEAKDLDDQDAIFEKFFGDVLSEDEAKTAPVEGDTNLIPEDMAAAGDGTEVVGSSEGLEEGADFTPEGILSEAFTMDPEGIFSDEEITKILADADLGEDSIVIDVPVEEGAEGESAQLDDLFSVSGEEDESAHDLAGDEGRLETVIETGEGTHVIGSGGLETGEGTETIDPGLARTDEMISPAGIGSGTEMINPELMRTDEVMPEPEDGSGTETINPELLRTDEVAPEAEDGSGTETINPELLRTEEISPNEEAEIEAELVPDDGSTDIGAGGILTSLLSSDDGADPFSEMRSEIEEKTGAGPAGETELTADQFVVVDPEEFKRLKDEQA